MFLAFILPGLLSIRLGDARWRSAAAWACVVLGAAMGAAAILSTLASPQGG